ncbi:hypothetical protein EC957_012115 [Mortierella hygrophila]|uniref:Uncharacterized protein n=1 Tax=Mortierella hygrophila TaxID=979708 RepID=A0A9P6F6Z8_9FUNG|nr:hypothetical protein EC957_012115 [Mortierella hygrophila]
MPPVPALGRPLAIIIGCALAFQLYLFFSSNSSSNDYRPEDLDPTPGSSDPASSRWDDPGRNRHPTVPLTLKDFSTLDTLADTIVKAEAYRVFEDKSAKKIHGSVIKGDAAVVQKVRDQIRCWTTYGSWQRQDQEFTPLNHLGDSRFAKCDKTFMKALDREGNGHYLGEFDHTHDRFMVREAVKYRWVPDTAKCGPGPGTMGLQDERAVYDAFTKPKFCEVMDERSFLVVGDVTQYQLHDVIASTFKSSFVCYGELGCLHHASHGLCNGVALKYARNDLLSVPWAVNPEDEEFPSASTVEQAWATPDMLLKYKILVLNRGLIWRPDEVFMSELVFTMKLLWKYYPDTMVIYRATHPISANCSQFKNHGEDEAVANKNGESDAEGITLQKPLQTAPKRQEAAAGEKQEFRPTLADIQRQNRIARVIVEAAGGIYLDTENMFALRPDGRMGDGDCARFCAPGPLDAYGDLLYNTIRLLRDKSINTV